MSGTDQIIQELAAPQQGVFTRAQARQQGVTRQMLGHRIRTGRLVVLDRTVLAIAGTPDTAHRRAIAGVLSIEEAAMSHHSAAAFWHLPGFAAEPVEVMSTRAGRGARITPLAVVHTTTLLPDQHLTVRDGLRVTVPVRTLFDLAGEIHPARLERSLDTAWRMGLVTGRLLRRTLAELAEHGRPGIQLMRELIMDRGDDYRPTDSNVEARFTDLMQTVGITTFDRQVDVGGQDWLGRVDFRDRVVPLVVEVDSETYHASLVDQAADEIRRQALRQAGYTVLVIRAFDIWHRAGEVQAHVRHARAKLLAAPSAEPVSPATTWESLR